MGKRFTQADIDRLEESRKAKGWGAGAVTVPTPPPAKQRFFSGWNQTQSSVFIGVDPGVKTGLAIWNSSTKKFDLITTTTITRAMEHIRQYVTAGHDVTVRVEDARKRKWFGERAESKQQGAGSVKRDASIWEDHLKEQELKYEMIHPIKGATKLSKEQFFKMTGYTGLTSEHSRDAAMMVFNF